MNKLISFLSIFAFVVLLSSCASNKSKGVAQSELSNKIITKIEQRIALTQDQKDKIGELAASSGLSAAADKTSESKVKYKSLMQKIKKEIFTEEQRSNYRKKKDLKS